MHIKAPKGYTIAFTTDGTRPSGKDACGESEVDVAVNRKMSGYLVNHRELIQCPEISKSVIRQNESLPAGIVLNTALVDRKGVVEDTVQTNVYFLQADFARRFPGCLIVSVTADPRDLLDYNTGIIASGAVYARWKNSDAGKKILAEKRYWWAESNSTRRGRNWERSCRIQFFNTGSTTPDLEVNAGMRVRGGSSRLKDQKSFTFYFRRKYGTALLRFALFGKPGVYKTFALRNGDVEYLKFKDTLLQDLGKGGKFTVLHSRPAVLFLNGEYWGPYSLNEIISGKMMETRFGVDKNNVVVIKESKVQVGKKEDLKLYEDLQVFAEMDFTDPEVYRQFCDTVDVCSMADYFAMRIYIGESDWTRNENHVLWRTRDKSCNGGRWQFIVHDTDESAGHYNSKSTACDTDHFRLAMSNFPVFGAALKNKEFYTMFLEAIKKTGSENYKFSRVQEKMEHYDKIWGPLMPDFYKRFGDYSQRRKQCMEATLDFFRRRYDFIIPVIESWKP